MSDNDKAKPEYDVLAEKTIGFHKNKFLEVTRKRIRGQSEELITLSKGYYGPTGKKNHKSTFGIPASEKKLIKDLADAIMNI
jgi:hypothetical protein